MMELQVQLCIPNLRSEWFISRSPLLSEWGYPDSIQFPLRGTSYFGCSNGKLLHGLVACTLRMSVPSLEAVNRFARCKAFPVFENQILVFL